MALEKDWITPHGVVGLYHRLQKVEILAPQQRVDILFAVYLDKAASDSGRTALYYNSVSIPLNLFEEDPRTVFYTAAKKYIDSYVSNAQNSLDPEQSVNISNTVNLKLEFTVDG